MKLVVKDFELMAPVVLHPNLPPKTDEEFVEFCRQYPDCMVEVSAEGEIIIMPPAYSRTGRRNNRIAIQLTIWADSDDRGEVYDGTCGIVLPNGARRSPDAFWIRKDRIAALPKKQQETFYRLCPDFVIELRSTTDRLKAQQRKMDEYMANGAELGWLVDPIERRVWIYRPGGPPEVLDNPERVSGEGCVAGFTLDLTKIWE